MSGFTQAFAPDIVAFMVLGIDGYHLMIHGDIKRRRQLVVMEVTFPLGFTREDRARKDYL